MQQWLQILAVAGACFGVLLLFLVVLWRCFISPKQERDLGNPNNGRGRADERFQAGISKLRHSSLGRRHDLRRMNYSMFRREASSKPLFSWADHPSLVTDAVENGWSRFSFAAPYGLSSSIRSARSAILGTCAAGDHGRENEVDISWEVSPGSADFMQKIRLNSGLKKTGSSPAVVKTALPLPGPPLGNSSFPQEAYFEIIILTSREDDHDPFGNRKRARTEGDRVKLIQAKSESLVHVSSNNKKLEELRLGGGREENKGEVVTVSVGLTREGSLPHKLPGSHSGSVGFNSDGSVHLDGIKLVFESEKGEWGRTEQVIGCGYNPRQRKIFFTVDSELVHMINCKSEEFATPLYPTLAANIDITVLVNFGQSVFKYEPANSQRTPNPCFIGPPVKSPALGYEDSRELFSMGRIDSEWLDRCATRRDHNNGSNNKALDFDNESEGDLFEIVLDKCGRSPNTVLH